MVEARWGPTIEEWPRLRQWLSIHNLFLENFLRSESLGDGRREFLGAFVAS